MNQPEPANRQRRRILFIDDSEDIRIIFEMMAQRRGYDVNCIPSVVGAADLWSRFKYDLVVTDVAIPGESGLILSRWIRDRDPEIPIFLYTGVPEGIDVEAYGANACFLKGGNLESLFAAISMTLYEPDNALIDDTTLTAEPTPLRADYCTNEPSAEA